MKKFKNKNFYIICFLIIVSIFCLFSLFFLWKETNFKTKTSYQMNYNPEYTRIYYDGATMPTVYMIEDFLKQSKDINGFVFWGRMPNVKEKIKNYKNVEILRTIDNRVASPIDGKMLQKYHEKHPDAKYIIYSNSVWLPNINAIFSIIPKENVKEIHLYEDASFAETCKINPQSEEKADFVKKYIIKDYNVIVHMEDANWLNSKTCFLHKTCRELKIKYKNYTVVKTSIEGLKQRLNDNSEIKKEYFSFFDFDYTKYKNEMVHPFGLWIFKQYVRHEDTIDEIAFLKEVLNGKYSYLIKNNNVRWFYKEHPTSKQTRLPSECVKAENINITKIERQIPIELFLIADIVPDYVAGHSSSAFLSIPKRNIIAYIKRDKDKYMFIINRDKKIYPWRIFELTDINNSLKSRLKRHISKILVSLE